MRDLLRFIGSIHFSLALFLFSAVVVACATFIDLSLEMQNGFFSLLIVGFFMNLLVALCRRYPFRRSHLAFIFAHCGLLVILGASLIRGYLGWEGVWIITKSCSQNELVREGHYPSVVLHPFQSACKKVGFSYETILSLWFEEWKNKAQSVFDPNQTLPFPVEKVMECLDWTALPVTLQQGALRLSYFLEKCRNAQISVTLAQEIFKNSQLPCKKGMSWTASEKAHLYSCCLFVEGLQHALFPLRLKEIPYAGTLLEVDDKNQTCSLSLKQSNGDVEIARIALNQPLDTADGYRFVLQELGSFQDQALFLVNWNPISHHWLVAGALLTVLGVVVLFIQKVIYGN